MATSEINEICDYSLYQIVCNLPNKLKRKTKELLLPFNLEQICMAKKELELTYSDNLKKLQNEEASIKQRLLDINMERTRIKNDHEAKIYEIRQPISNILKSVIADAQLIDSKSSRYYLELKHRTSDINEIKTTIELAEYISINNHWYCDNKIELNDLMNNLIINNYLTFKDLKDLVLKCICYIGTIHNKDKDYWEDFLETTTNPNKRVNAREIRKMSECYELVSKVISINSKWELKIIHDEGKHYKHNIVKLFEIEGVIKNEDNTPKKYIDDLIKTLIE